MQIIEQYPPNIDEIRKTFDIPEKGIIFTYGDKLYNPDKEIIADHLIIHEESHERQQKNPKEWWDRYLTDKDFRLDQELEAYANQYNFYKEYNTNKRVKIFLEHIARDLSSPIYGNLLTLQEAESKIRNYAKYTKNIKKNS